MYGTSAFRSAFVREMYGTSAFRSAFVPPTTEEYGTSAFVSAINPKILKPYRTERRPKKKTLKSIKMNRNRIAPIGSATRIKKPKCDKAFVQAFADKLHMLLKAANACFLTGSFVIGDDDDHKFADMLGTRQTFSYRDTLNPREMNAKLFGTCRVRPVAWTHTEFMKNKDFQIAKNNFSDSKVVSSSQHQEISTAPDILIEYACDRECRGNGAGESCKDNNRVPKRVALWYTFEVEAADTQKKFVFLKFETDPALSVRHGVDAIRNYYTKHGADRKNDYTTRRESLAYVLNPKYVEGKTKEKKYISLRALHKKMKISDPNDSPIKTFELKEIPHTGYQHADADNEALEKMCRILGISSAAPLLEKKWYDEHVRTRDEMYVPFAFVEALNIRTIKDLEIDIRNASQASEITELPPIRLRPTGPFNGPFNPLQPIKNGGAPSVAAGALMVAVTIAASLVGTMCS
jgi:hypothetical protein